MGVGDAQGQPPRPDAAGIAGESPGGIQALELGQKGVETRAAVGEQLHVLMAEDDIVAAGGGQQPVAAGEGVEAVAGAVVEMEIFAFGRGEAAGREGVRHPPILLGPGDQGADGIAHAAGFGGSVSGVGEGGKGGDHQ